MRQDACSSGRGQGRPWTGGRETTGSPVDGRPVGDRVTGGRPVEDRIARGRARVTRGRTDGRTAVDRVARRMRPACRPPPLLPFVDSHLRGQTAPGATDGTVVFARLEASKSQSPSSGGGSRGGSAMVGAVGNSAAHTKSVTQPALFRPPTAARRAAAHASSEGLWRGGSMRGAVWKRTNQQLAPLLPQRPPPVPMGSEG